MFATYAQALLSVGNSWIFYGFVAQKNVFEGRHATVDEHERGVVFHHYGGAGHNFVSFAFKKIEESFSNIVGSHYLILV